MLCLRRSVVRTEAYLSLHMVSLNMDYRHIQQRKSMHGRIVQDLGMDIVGGKVAPGERLPAEVLLCETYGVSRPVLREATRVLVAKGLVVSKPRVGSIVRPRAD